MPQRNSLPFNALIKYLVRKGQENAAWALFTRMHRTGMDLDEYTFTAILGACYSLPIIKQVHSLLVKRSFRTETVLNTALIDIYFKCGSAVDAFRVFQVMGARDVVAWNTMISGLVQQGLAGDAVGLFLEMQRHGVDFSEFTLCALLKACSFLTALRQGKQIHAVVIVSGSDLLVLGTALVGLYSGCGFMVEAMKVLTGLDCRDEVLYNALISGFVQNGQLGKAFSMLGTMRKEFSEPNTMALASLVAGCSDNSGLSNGEQIHGLLIRCGLESTDTVLCNALLDMYAKCGKMSNARRVFDGITDKNVVSWTSIIDAYGSHGQGIEALSLFEKMVESNRGVSPNSVTWLAVLSACSHSGLVDQARNYFVAMREKHCVNPEHYTCFIDLLGRSGRIEEAWDLLQSMDTEPTAAIWAAMLNACRINLDLVRGELAAKRVFELDPGNPANYVLHSNFYAAVGRWESAESLRRVMREKGLRKEAGSSWFAK